MDDGITGGKLANVDAIVVVRHGVLVYERCFVYPSSSSMLTRPLGTAVIL